MGWTSWVSWGLNRDLKDSESWRVKMSRRGVLEGRAARAEAQTGSR